jgi:hypothetical protein
MLSISYTTFLFKIKYLNQKKGREGEKKRKVRKGMRWLGGDGWPGAAIGQRKDLIMQKDE